MTINERIASLREAMKAQGFDAYIIPSSDAHQSEYVADFWKMREWISGFTGSAGTLVITTDHAGLWTDSRYFLQAETQLENSEIELHKQGVPHAPEHEAWLKDELPEGAKVGVNGWQFSTAQVQRLRRIFSSKNITISTSSDLISAIWDDQTPLPMSPIFEHDVHYAGKSRTEKLTAIRAVMKADYYLITTLDDIAWALNLRGKDVACNPVFYSYVVVEEERTLLFIEPQKVSESLAKQLAKEQIFIKPYATIDIFLEELPEGKTIQIDVSTTNAMLCRSTNKEQAVKGKNIVRPLKAIKNEIEIQHIREVMVKDGVALTHLFRWLEKTVQERPIPEVEVAEKLIEFRRAQGDYHDESFDAIVGYKGNGAIVHYRAQKDTCAHIQADGILLLDSGGQYLNGTTDITRTIALGEPTTEQKRHNTLVLKGHIALAQIQFPAGTSGAQLDSIARMFLWNDRLNYGHGTGHGVGFFLNVHEPPQGFATGVTTSRGTTAIQPGMFTSNEPGFYKTDEYGIRIENLILCVEAEENDYGNWLQFETLTLFPIDLKLIDSSLLNNKEKAWLNNYHETVFKQLSPKLNAEEVAWLKTKTTKIG